jgi:non-canonical (house-cleaning) NTP pyrophosphatase
LSRGFWRLVITAVIVENRVEGTESMHIGDFWQRLQRGVEVAVAGSTPDRHLGVRDGFRRFFRERFDRPISIAVVPQEGLEEPTGLAIADAEVMAVVAGRAENLEERLRGQYHFFVSSEGGLHTVERRDQALHFVRNWTLVASPIGHAWGSSGSVQLPGYLVSGIGRDDLPFAVPGTRRSGGMISSLTGGLETRRRAVETATVHASPICGCRS